MRIDVSGVFSPCETLLTNPAFSLASFISRMTARAVSTPPARMPATENPMMYQ
jgi:hypothetical protein